MPQRLLLLLACSVTQVVSHVHNTSKCFRTNPGVHTWYMACIVCFLHVVAVIVFPLNMQHTQMQRVN